ncbi:MAG: choice-of-anchor D domain-containing protein, partial [Thermodesulfobacteriota bacterium]
MRFSRIVIIAFILIGGLFLLHDPVYAALQGSEIVVSNASEDQQNPHTIYLPDKGTEGLSFVVWEDWRNRLTTGADIYGQFRDATGSLCGAEFVISNAAGNQTVPKAAYRDGVGLADTTDRIVVAWEDTRGTAASGFVYFTDIDISEPPFDPATCAGYVIGAENPVSYTQILEYTWPTTATIAVPDSIGTGDGATKDFFGALSSFPLPVEPGTLRVTVDGVPVLIDDGLGGFTGGGTGEIFYEAGIIIITFTTAPATGAVIEASYDYFTSFPPSTASIGDSLLSRKSPKIIYDPVRDRFWIVWMEARDIMNRTSNLCFGFIPVAWWFDSGDSSFPGYVMLDGSTLAEIVNNIGVTADIIRDAQTRTNRLVAFDIKEMEERYEYEFFGDANNINLSTDTTSPETFMVWEGMRKKAEITCTCTDKNSNKICDLADTYENTLTLSDYDDGLVHIYGLFDKRIDGMSRRIDTSASPTYYPSVAFDPATGRFLTVWEDLRDDALNIKIYGQLVYSGGGLYNNNFIISYQDTDQDGAQDTNVVNSRQTDPFISYDPVNQRFFVIWQDGRNGSLSLENLDVYGQYVDLEGTLRGSNHAISTTPSNQLAPVISYNESTKEFLAVWKDARNTSVSGSDLYGQRFTLGQPSIRLLQMDDTAMAPFLVSGFENPTGTGNVEVGLFDTQSFQIESAGDTILKIDYVDETCNGTQTDISPFMFDGIPTELTARDGVTLDLVPGDRIPLTIRFTPVAGGSYNRCFIIESDGGNPRVNLSAQAVEPNIAISTPPTPYDFGNIFTGSYGEQTFAVRNTWLAALTISSLNNPQTPFSTQTDGCTGQSIAQGSTCDIVVRFTPTTAGAFNSQFDIISNDPDTPTLNVVISGTGVGAQDITVTPTSIDFGDVQNGQTSQQNITIQNDGTATLTISSVTNPVTPFSIV